MTTVTIQDQTLHGNIVHELFLKFSTQRISAADLIAARVREEVAQYNQRANDHLHFLVQPDEREAVLNGYDQNKPKKIIDADKQITIALKAFEQNGFFILADNRQLETLDETVYLHDKLIVNFIKLTPLVGG